MGTPVAIGPPWNAAEPPEPESAKTSACTFGRDQTPQKVRSSGKKVPTFGPSTVRGISNLKGISS